MLDERICKLRQKLNESIMEGQDYNVTYKLSVELDQLIAEYYKKSLRGINKKIKIRKRKRKIERTYILTGDERKIAEKIAKEVNVDICKSELLPDQKLENLEEILKERKGKEKVIFVGDGVNDSPCLARADIGIAMGGIGADAAIEAADVVIMTDELTKIAQAIKVSKKTMKIVKQNIVFALVVKVLVLILGALGIANMWLAVFADVGVSMLAILNSMKTLKA